MAESKASMPSKENAQESRSPSSAEVGKPVLHSAITLHTARHGRIMMPL